MPAKRKPFFTQCFGRASLSTARPSDRRTCGRGSMVGGGDDDAPAETVSLMHAEYGLVCEPSNAARGLNRQDAKDAKKRGEDGNFFFVGGT